MKKTRIRVFGFIVLMVASVMWVNPVYADGFSSEKPITIKGLQIGMDVFEAKVAIDRALLNSEWTASNVDTIGRLLKSGFCDEEIFGNANDGGPFSGDRGARQNTSGLKTLPIVGNNGMMIKKNNGYLGGFISIDKVDNKVTQISFGSLLTNDLFLTKDITSDDFVHAFISYYNMPEFPWVPRGWRYVSPFNYAVHITTEKMIDIKKESGPPRPFINFN